MEATKEASSLSDFERAHHKCQVLSKPKRVLLFKEISWRQLKIRGALIQRERQVHKFFYMVANSHMRSNAIDSLMVDGVVFSD